jgi:outer membrane protein
LLIRIIDNIARNCEGEIFNAMIFNPIIIIYPVRKLSLVLILFSLAVTASADTTETADTIEGANWGIAIGYRYADIPYPAKDESVDDFIPLDIFFIRGLTLGAKLHNQDAWQFNLLGRYRYLDIPEEYQNRVQGNEFDVGGEVRYRFDNDFEASLEFMSDDDSRYYSSLGARYLWESGSLELFPFATLRFKSADFNDRYYGLDGYTNPDNPTEDLGNKIGSGIDLTLGSEIRYHVISNLYLLGRAQLTVLDEDTYDSPTIEDQTYGEVYMGIAFFNDKTKKKPSPLEAKPYFRLAHGWATPSNIAEIFELDWESDSQNNQLTSIFYGHPVADSLFGIEEIDLYMTVGYVYHHNAGSSDQTLDPGKGINTVKDSNLGSNPCDGTSPCTISYNSQPTNEYVLGLKLYYNFYWPAHWRFGFAEGISYIEDVSNIEQKEMDRKGYRSSKLMNYLDFTLDFSVGDTFNNQELKELYFGIGVHHRSSIFESNSQFGRIKGGSNYNSLYLQYHF